MPRTTDTRTTSAGSCQPGDGTPPPSRRRLLGGVALTVAAAVAPVAAVLSPDPTWGTPATPGASSDTALLAAIARGTEIYDRARQAQAESWGSYRTWILDNCHEIVPLDEFIFSTQALTREGAMAKAAYALKDYRQPEGEGRIGAFHFPYSALHDLVRVMGGEVPA